MGGVHGMTANVLRIYAVRNGRAVRWWALGLAALAIFEVLIFPVISEIGDFAELFEDMPEVMEAFVGGTIDISTLESFLQAEMYGLLVPILFAIFAISLGSGTLAGEEESGILDFLLAQPVSRTRLLFEKGIALFLGVALLGVVLWASLLVGAVFADVDLGIAAVTRATFSAFLLGCFFGALSLLISAITGRRGTTLALSGGITVVAYLLNAFYPIVGAITGARYVTPFYYYGGNQPLTNALSPTHVTVLFAAIVVAMAAAVWAFNRRQLGT
jgi:ABC-2 type transport system permease protein